MDTTAISKELEQIEIQLRDPNLRERRALLKGYLEGVEAGRIEGARDEQNNSNKLLEDQQKKFDELLSKKTTELNVHIAKLEETLAKVTDVA